MKSIHVHSVPFVDDGDQEGFLRMEVCGVSKVGMLPVWTTIGAGVHLADPTFWVYLRFDDVESIGACQNLVNELFGLYQEPSDAGVYVVETIEREEAVYFSIDHRRGIRVLSSDLAMWDRETKVLKMGFPANFIWHNVLSWAYLEEAIFNRSAGVSWDMSDPNREGSYHSTDCQLTAVPKDEFRWFFEVMGTTEKCTIQGAFDAESESNILYVLEGPTPS